MDNRIPANDDERLAQRLRHEAMLERPVFSASLHERICEAVQQQSVPGTKIRRPRLSRHTIRWVAAAAVAASLLIAMLAWRANRPDANVGNSGEQQIAQVPSVVPTPQPLVEEVAPAARVAHELTWEVPAFVDATIAAGRWAYLDHDALLTLEMIASRFPLEITSQGTAEVETMP